uniref:Terminal recognition factor-like protein n=1 Tax=Komagataella phaffii TaxID=460519 RepID=A0A2R4PI81_9ASCO|nr:terminal recognition factor-like protein [Komagataella phaffii]
MSKKEVNKAISILNKSIINDIIIKIENLDIDDKDKQLIKDTITSYKQKPKRKAPKIPLEKQCREMTKKGEKCTVPKCYKGVCWAHMNKDEREKYRSMKKVTEV